MKFKDLTLKEHTFALDLSYKLKDKANSKSGPQYKLGQMLARIYGSQNVFEDVPLPGCGNLSWDFWLPSFKICFEYDGRQHNEFSKFFHGNKQGFLKQKNIDAKKEKLAEINGIRLIRMNKELTIEELKTLIIGSNN